VGLERSDVRQTTDRLPNTERRRIARRAQEYIEQNFRQPNRIDEICQETGAGLRTLQRSFKEYFSVSVTEYLKLVRLDALHRDLCSADPLEMTVAELGMKNGFTHLGRLAVDFRKQFGQSPSKVLLRAHQIAPTKRITKAA
jgi:AraC family ethanolamine operon transcriptional activator